MVFSSLSFIFLFLPILITVYLLSPTIRIKNLVLCLFSLIFYAWGEPFYIILMLFSIFNDYFHSLWIEKSENINTRKIALVSSIAINILMLSIFKYADFIIENLNYLFDLNWGLLNLPLPIGISFYTFQTMSYTIDVYRGKVKAQKNIMSLGTYVALFPQLIAGPIVRYETIEKELAEREIDIHEVYEGLKRFIIGLAKKVIIANNVALISDQVFGSNLTNLPSAIAWLGIIAYSLQIYFDFSGYSDMAIGLGRILGFHYLKNFNYPYIAQSVTDFWRRWHISLSSWFRDYLYIPLGGNRVAKAKWIGNMVIVWLLTGLWHGSSWNFAVWGIYYGVLLIFEKMILQKININKILMHIYTLIAIIIGWTIFKIDSLGGIYTFIKVLFTSKVATNLTDLYHYEIIGNIPFLILGIIFSTPLFTNILNIVKRQINSEILEDILVSTLFIASILFLINHSFNPFIYFRF